MDIDIAPRPDEYLCTSDNELEGLRSDFGTESEEESSGSDNEDSGEESSGSDNEDPGDEHPAGSSRAQNHAVGSPLHSTVCSTGERKKTDAPPRSFDSQRAAEEWFSRESSLAFLIEKYAGAHKLIGFFWVRMRVHISSLGSFAFSRLQSICLRVSLLVIIDDVLFSTASFWKLRDSMNTKQGPLAEDPQLARQYMQQAAPGLEELLKAVDSQQYPDMTVHQAKIKYRNMAEALRLAREISMSGTIDKHPWVCLGVEFITSLSADTRAKLDRIEELWMELHAWIVAQLSCSGNTTVFNVPCIDEDILDPNKIMLFILLHYASLADSKDGYVTPRP